MSSFIAMNDPPEVLRCMKVMRGPRYADVVIWCQRRKFFAHRSVLAACSRQFACILDELPDEESRFPVIVMNEAHPDVMCALLDMIYGEEIHIKRELVFHFLAICESMDIEFRGTGGEEIYGGTPSVPGKRRLINFDNAEPQRRPRPPARCIPDIVSQDHAIEFHVHCSWVGQLEGSGIRVYFCDICQFVTKSDACMRDHLISTHPVFDREAVGNLRVVSVESLSRGKPGVDVLVQPHAEAPEVLSRDWSAVKVEGTEHIWAGASADDWTRTVYYCGKCFEYWSDYKDQLIYHEKSACSTKKRTKSKKPDRRVILPPLPPSTVSEPLVEVTPEVRMKLAGPLPGGQGFLCNCGNYYAKKGGLLIHKRFCKSREPSTASETVDLAALNLCPHVCLHRLNPCRLERFATDSQETVASQQHLAHDDEPSVEEKDEPPAAPPQSVEPVSQKRPRGRPKKASYEQKAPRPRGRPKKNASEETLSSVVSSSMKSSPRELPLSVEPVPKKRDVGQVSVESVPGKKSEPKRVVPPVEASVAKRSDPKQRPVEQNSSQPPVLSLVPARVAAAMPPPLPAPLKKEIVAQRGHLQVIIKSEQVAEKEYMNHVMIKTNAPSLPSSLRSSPTPSVDSEPPTEAKVGRSSLHEPVGETRDWYCMKTLPGYKRTSGVLSLPASPTASPVPSWEKNGVFKTEPESEDDAPTKPRKVPRVCLYHTTMKSMENCTCSDPRVVPGPDERPSMAPRCSDGDKKQLSNGQGKPAKPEVCDRAVQARRRKMRNTLFGPMLCSTSEETSSESSEVTPRLFVRSSFSLPKDYFLS